MNRTEVSFRFTVKLNDLKERRSVLSSLINVMVATATLPSISLQIELSVATGVSFNCIRFYYVSATNVEDSEKHLSSISVSASKAIEINYIYFGKNVSLLYLLTSYNCSKVTKFVLLLFILRLEDRLMTTHTSIYNYINYLI